jgi:hypothetical protein
MVVVTQMKTQCIILNNHLVRWRNGRRYIFWKEIGIIPTLNQIKDDMREIIETVIHDFLTDPLYYITIALSWILLGVLIVGVIF